MVAIDVEGNGRGARRRARATDEATAPPAPSGVAPPGRRVRLPELAAGVLVMVVFAVGVVLWHLGTVERVPALALSRAVGRGEVLDRGDLRVVNVSADRGLARLDPSSVDRVAGRVALVDLPTGALVTEEAVAASTAIGGDEGVVGLSLEPGQYPSADLAVGDYVSVVTQGGSDSGRDSPTVVPAAEVVGVDDLSAERKLVSLRAERGDAREVASLDSATLHLVLVTP